MHVLCLYYKTREEFQPIWLLLYVCTKKQKTNKKLVFASNRKNYIMHIVNKKIRFILLLTDLIGSESGGHPRVFLQRASGIVVRVRVPLLRVASAHRGRHHRVMVVVPVVPVEDVRRQVAVVVTRDRRRRVFAAGGRGHGSGGRGRGLHGRGGGQQLLVTADRLVVTGRSRGQRRQRWRRRAPLDAGRHRRHYGRATNAAWCGPGDLSVVAAAVVVIVVVVSRTVAVPAHLSVEEKISHHHMSKKKKIVKLIIDRRNIFYVWCGTGMQTKVFSYSNPRLPRFFNILYTRALPKCTTSNNQ